MGDGEEFHGRFRDAGLAAAGPDVRGGRGAADGPFERNSPAQDEWEFDDASRSTRTTASEDTP